VTLRAIQGFAVGGEWGGAALMAVESAPERKKAFYSSGVQVGYGRGPRAVDGPRFADQPVDGQCVVSSHGAGVCRFLFQRAARAGRAVDPLKHGGVAGVSSTRSASMGERGLRLPIVEALLRHPRAFLLIIALRLAELFTMYIVTRVRTQLLDGEPSV